MTKGPKGPTSLQADVAHAAADFALRFCATESRWGPVSDNSRK
jgi:hypothetical protein